MFDKLFPRVNSVEILGKAEELLGQTGEGEIFIRKLLQGKIDLIKLSLKVNKTKEIQETGENEENEESGNIEQPDEEPAQ